MFSTRDLLKARKFTRADVFVLIVLAAIILAVVTTAQRWTHHYQQEVSIDLGTNALFGYAALSFIRAIIAYVISLLLALLFGWLAARSIFWEQIILPFLDIGQSVPVLGFLPGLVLGLISIFPTYNIGLELACILLIVSSQIWNIAFAFYASLKSIPQEFYEVAKISHLNRLSRFLKIDLPFSATPLAWNSLVSIAGGWFFLTVCESFQLNGQNFRIPGLGSYMSEALNQGNQQAIWMGIGAMMILIILIDFIIWRPIISWSQKFRVDDQSINDLDVPFVSLLYRQSKIAEYFSSFLRNLKSKLRRLEKPEEETVALDVLQTQPLPSEKKFKASKILIQTRKTLLFTFAFILAFWTFGKLYRLVEPLTWSEWGLIGYSCFLTFCRIFAALILSTIWALPVGILIGLSPKLTRIFQPIIQIIASFPSPMIFPLVFLLFYKMNIDLGVSSIFILVVGSQWYILFNVLAGSSQISQQHKDSFHLMQLGWKEHWKTLYLPSIFPYLVTGWITAAGGAWNASIIAEYLEYGGKTYTCTGIGSVITMATGSGNFPLLSAALMVMVGVVVLLNRSVWKFLFHYAETRFKVEV
jgi:NitT/TauT family transport system permease protein